MKGIRGLPVISLDLSPTEYSRQVACAMRDLVRPGKIDTRRMCAKGSTGRIAWDEVFPDADPEYAAEVGMWISGAMRAYRDRHHIIL